MKLHPSGTFDTRFSCIIGESIESTELAVDPEEPIVICKRQTRREFREKNEKSNPQNHGK